MAIINETNNPFDFIKKITLSGNTLTNDANNCDALAKTLKDNSIWVVAAQNEAIKIQEKAKSNSNKSKNDINNWNREIQKIDAEIADLSRGQDPNDGTGSGRNSAYSLDLPGSRSVKPEDDSNENTKTGNTNKNDSKIQALVAKRGALGNRISTEINHNSTTIKNLLNTVKQNVAIAKAKKQEAENTIAVAKSVSDTAGIASQLSVIGKTVIVPALLAAPEPVISKVEAAKIITVCTITDIAATTAGVAANLVSVEAANSISKADDATKTFGLVTAGVQGLTTLLPKFFNK